MFKNALLSIKKSFGKTILLLILMIVIFNLVIAGLSIKRGISKSMDSVRTSLGSDVTLSYNMKSMMSNRKQGESMDKVMKSITVKMADSLKDLKYVKNYNYSVNVNASSDDIEPVKMQEDDTSDDRKTQFHDEKPMFMDQNNFNVVGNSTMEYITQFNNENYQLTSGRLLTNKDINTKNCVIEKNLASDNDLKVGSTFSVTTTIDETTVKKELKVVGIFSIETSNEMGGMMSNRQSPMNTIYTGLNIAQSLNGSDTEITSATYYLDDPAHIDAFKTLAQSQSDIDFDTYTLDANDMVYQQSIASLENMDSFASMLLWVVVIAGSAILCLILVLTLRNRFYEFGIMLSLGLSKFKIIGQQLLEIGIIAIIAFSISLCSGKMVSNVVGSMLESSQNENHVVMNMDEKDTGRKEEKRKDLMDRALNAPVSQQLDVSLTSSTMINLFEIMSGICIVSIILPSLYILRLSPREILIKREG